MSNVKRPTFWNRKLKDAQPARLLQPAVWRAGTKRWFDNYYMKYVRGGSAKPLIHLILAIGITGYSMEWYTKHKYHQKRRWH